MGFSDWRIGARIGAGFALLIATLMLVLGFTLASFGRQNEADARNRESARAQEAAQALLLAVVNMETGLRGFVASGKESFLDAYEEGRTAFAPQLSALDAASAGRPEQQQRVAGMRAARAGFGTVAESLIKKRRDATELMSGTDELVAAFSQGDDKKATDEFRRLVAAYQAAEAAQSAQRSAEAAGLREATRGLLIGGGLAAVVFAAAIGWWLTRSIARPLDAAVQASRRVAQGDLTAALQIDRRDEVGALLASLHGMQASLTAIVGGVRAGAEKVAASSAHIAHGSRGLSERSEQQASALEQAAAAMEQLQGTVSSNADSARQASELAAGASAVAVRGGAAVGRVVETMRGIQQASSRIADIIGTIDGIAFQTNVLALNAAVEAARAGEQGRGFAVVAGEVRSLAQRSSEAAREIKVLIGDSVERVGAGTQHVDEAGATMQEVVAAIGHVSEIVERIATASREQTAGIGEVGSAVTVMEQATQQSAALVGESAAAAEGLSAQARQLVDSVAVFRIAEPARA